MYRGPQSRALPQLSGQPFLTDGGIETSLIFHDGLDLPHFAAFTLLDTPSGRESLRQYFQPYLEIAAQMDTGFVLESPTWRASRDWGALLGYDAKALDRANRAAIDLLASLRAGWSGRGAVVLSGCIGPRGDGYAPGRIMAVDEARAYHAAQIESFARSHADMVTAITMTQIGEAIGISFAAERAQLPVALSFTVETDGRLPSGEALGAAIEAVDAATAGYPAYYMVNCAHPSHFVAQLETGENWVRRIRGIRANASCLSHAELDAATELDEGDPGALGEEYRALKALLPELTIYGGCCGTDHRHIAAIARTCCV